MIQGSNASRGRGFFLSPNCQNWLWGPPSLLFKGYQGSFLGVKQWGVEVDHSPPFSSKVKNDRSYASTPPYMPSWCGQEKIHFSYK